MKKKKVKKKKENRRKQKKTEEKNQTPIPKLKVTHSPRAMCSEYFK